MPSSSSLFCSCSCWLITAMMTTATATTAAIGNKNATNLLLQKVSKYIFQNFSSWFMSAKAAWVGTAFDFAVFHFDFVASFLLLVVVASTLLLVVVCLIKTTKFCPARAESKLNYVQFNFMARSLGRISHRTKVTQVQRATIEFARLFNALKLVLIFNILTLNCFVIDL